MEHREIIFTPPRNFHQGFPYEMSRAARETDFMADGLGSDEIAGLAEHGALRRYANLLCSSVQTAAHSGSSRGDEQAGAARTEVTPAVLDGAPWELAPAAQPTRLFGGGGRRELARSYFHLQG